MTTNFSLFGMYGDNRIRKKALKLLYELRCEGNFGNENNAGMGFFELLHGESEIEISLTGASDSVQEFGMGFDFFEIFESNFLRLVKGNILRQLSKICVNFLFG